MVDAGRVLANLEELRALTADEAGGAAGGVVATWLKARAWFEEKLKAVSRRRARSWKRIMMRRGITG